MPLSAAEILGLGGLRGEVLRIPADSVLCVHLAHDTTPDAREALGYALARLAEHWDVSPSRVLVLERGLTLEAMDDAGLARLGLRRMGGNDGA
jgi:hypothetical protein